MMYENEVMTCPSCKGLGFYTEWYNEWDGYEVDCVECDGLGEI